MRIKYFDPENIWVKPKETPWAEKIAELREMVDKDFHVDITEDKHRYIRLGSHFGKPLEPTTQKRLKFDQIKLFEEELTNRIIFPVNQDYQYFLPLEGKYIDSKTGYTHSYQYRQFGLDFDKYSPTIFLVEIKENNYRKSYSFNKFTFNNIRSDVSKWFPIRMLDLLKYSTDTLKKLRMTNTIVSINKTAFNYPGARYYQKNSIGTSDVMDFGILGINPIVYPNTDFHPTKMPTLILNTYWNTVASPKNIENPYATAENNLSDYGKLLHLDKLIADHKAPLGLNFVVGKFSESQQSEFYHADNDSQVGWDISNLAESDHSFREDNRAITVPSLNSLNALNNAFPGSGNKAKIDELCRFLRGSIPVNNFNSNSQITGPYGGFILDNPHSVDPRQFANMIIPVHGAKILYNPIMKTITPYGSKGFVLRRVIYHNPNKPDMVYFTPFSSPIIPTREYRQRLSIDLENPDFPWEPLQLVNTAMPMNLLYGISKSHLNSKWNYYWQYDETAEENSDDSPFLMFESTQMVDNDFNLDFLNLSGYSLGISSEEYEQDKNNLAFDNNYLASLNINYDGTVELIGKPLFSLDGTVQIDPMKARTINHLLINGCPHRGYRTIQTLGTARDYVTSIWVRPMTFPRNAIRYVEGGKTPLGKNYGYGYLLRDLTWVQQSDISFSVSGAAQSTSTDRFTNLRNIPPDGLNKPMLRRWINRDLVSYRGVHFPNKFIDIGLDRETYIRSTPDGLAVLLNKLPLAHKVVYQKVDNVTTFNWNAVKTGTIIGINKNQASLVPFMTPSGKNITNEAVTNTEHNVMVPVMSIPFLGNKRIQYHGRYDVQNPKTLTPASLYFDPNGALFNGRMRGAVTPIVDHALDYPRPMYMVKYCTVQLTGNQINGVPIYGYTSLLPFSPLDKFDPIDSNPFRNTQHADNINIYNSAYFVPGAVSYYRLRELEYRGILKRWNVKPTTDIVDYGKRYMAEFKEDGTTEVFKTRREPGSNKYHSVIHGRFYIIPLDETIVTLPHGTSSIYSITNGNVLIFKLESQRVNVRYEPYDIYIIEPINKNVEIHIDLTTEDIDLILAFSGNEITYRKVDLNPQRKNWLRDLVLGNYGLNAPAYYPSHFDKAHRSGAAEITSRPEVAVGKLLSTVAEVSPTMSVFNHYGQIWVPEEMHGKDIGFLTEDIDRETIPLLEMFDVPDWCEGWWNEEGEQIGIDRKTWTMTLPVPTWFQFRSAAYDHELANCNFVIVKLPKGTYPLGKSIEKIIRENWETIEHGCFVDETTYRKVVAGIKTMSDSLPVDKLGNKVFNTSPMTDEQKKTLDWFGTNGYFPVLYFSIPGTISDDADWQDDLFSLVIRKDGCFTLETEWANTPNNIKNNTTEPPKLTASMNILKGSVNSNNLINKVDTVIRLPFMNVNTTITSSRGTGFDAIRSSFHVTYPTATEFIPPLDGNLTFAPHYRIQSHPLTGSLLPLEMKSIHSTRIGDVGKVSYNANGDLILTLNRKFININTNRNQPTVTADRNQSGTLAYMPFIKVTGAPSFVYNGVFNDQHIRGGTFSSGRYIYPLPNAVKGFSVEEGDKSWDMENRFAMSAFMVNHFEIELLSSRNPDVKRPIDSLVGFTFHDGAKPDGIIDAQSLTDWAPITGDIQTVSQTIRNHYRTLSVIGQTEPKISWVTYSAAEQLTIKGVQVSGYLRLRPEVNIENIVFSDNAKLTYGTGKYFSFMSDFKGYQESMTVEKLGDKSLVRDLRSADVSFQFNWQLQEGFGGGIISLVDNWTNRALNSLLVNDTQDFLGTFYQLNDRSADGSVLIGPSNVQMKALVLSKKYDPLTDAQKATIDYLKRNQIIIGGIGGSKADTKIPAADRLTYGDTVLRKQNGVFIQRDGTLIVGGKLLYSPNQMMVSITESDRDQTNERHGSILRLTNKSAPFVSTTAYPELDGSGTIVRYTGQITPSPGKNIPVFNGGSQSFLLKMYANEKYHSGSEIYPFSSEGLDSYINDKFSFGATFTSFIYGDKQEFSGASIVPTLYEYFPFSQPSDFTRDAESYFQLRKFDLKINTGRRDGGTAPVGSYEFDMYDADEGWIRLKENVIVTNMTLAPASNIDLFLLKVFAPLVNRIPVKPTKQYYLGSASAVGNRNYRLDNKNVLNDYTVAITGEKHNDIFIEFKLPNPVPTDLTTLDSERGINFLDQLLTSMYYSSVYTINATFKRQYATLLSKIMRIVPNGSVPYELTSSRFSDSGYGNKNFISYRLLLQLDHEKFDQYSSTNPTEMIDLMELISKMTLKSGIPAGVALFGLRGCFEAIYPNQPRFNDIGLIKLADEGFYPDNDVTTYSHQTQTLFEEESIPVIHNVSKMGERQGSMPLLINRADSLSRYAELNALIYARDYSVSVSMTQSSLVTPQGPLSDTQIRILNWLNLNDYDVIGGQDVTRRSTSLNRLGHLNVYGDMPEPFFEPTSNKDSFRVNRFTYGIETNYNPFSGKENPWYKDRNNITKVSLHGAGFINPYFAPRVSTAKYISGIALSDFSFSHDTGYNVKLSPFKYETDPLYPFNGWNRYRTNLYTQISGLFLEEEQKGYKAAGILARRMVDENGYHMWDVPIFTKGQTINLTTNGNYSNSAPYFDLLSSYPFWSFRFNGFYEAIPDGTLRYRFLCLTETNIAGNKVKRLWNEDDTKSAHPKFPVLINQLDAIITEVKDVIIHEGGDPVTLGTNISYIINPYGEVVFIRAKGREINKWEHLDIHFNETAYLETIGIYPVPFRHTGIKAPGWDATVGISRNPYFDKETAVVVGPSGNTMIYYGLDYRHQWDTDKNMYVQKHPYSNLIAADVMGDYGEYGSFFYPKTTKSAGPFGSMPISEAHTDYGWALLINDRFIADGGLVDMLPSEKGFLLGKPKLENTRSSRFSKCRITGATLKTSLSLFAPDSNKKTVFNVNKSTLTIVNNPGFNIKPNKGYSEINGTTGAELWPVWTANLDDNTGITNGKVLDPVYTRTNPNEMLQRAPLHQSPFFKGFFNYYPGNMETIQYKHKLSVSFRSSYLRPTDKLDAFTLILSTAHYAQANETEGSFSTTTPAGFGNFY